MRREHNPWCPLQIFHCSTHVYYMRTMLSHVHDNTLTSDFILFSSLNAGSLHCSWKLNRLIKTLWFNHSHHPMYIFSVGLIVYQVFYFSYRRYAPKCGICQQPIMPEKVCVGMCTRCVFYL